MWKGGWQRGSERALTSPPGFFVVSIGRMKGAGLTPATPVRGSRGGMESCVRGMNSGHPRCHRCAQPGPSLCARDPPPPPATPRQDRLGAAGQAGRHLRGRRCGCRHRKSRRRRRPRPGPRPIPSSSSWLPVSMSEMPWKHCTVLSRGLGWALARDAEKTTSRPRVVEASSARTPKN